LGGGSPSVKRDASPASTSGPSPSGSTTPAPQTQTLPSDVPSTISSTNAATPSSQRTTPENPFLKLEIQESQTPKPISITINPAENSSKRPRPEDTVTGPPLRKPAVTPQEESIEAFENRVLTNIFRLTLDEGQKTDSNGHRLVFLPNLKEELSQAGEPLKLSAGVLDSAILEAASKIPQNKPILDYLLPCWKRIFRTMRKERGLSAKKDTVLKEAKRLCMSNCIFAVTVPELYGSVEI
jgi:ubiquitin conjugation factor E4 B